MKNTLEITEEDEDDFNTINVDKERIMRIVEYQKSLQSSSSSSFSAPSYSSSRRNLLELMKGGNTSLRRLFDMEHTSLSNHFYDYSGSPTFKSIPLWDSDSEHEFQGSDSWRHINQQLITIKTGSGSDGLSGFSSEGSILVGESYKSSAGKNKKRRRKHSGRLVRTKSFKRLPGFKSFRFRWWRRLKIIICDGELCRGQNRKEQVNANQFGFPGNRHDRGIKAHQFVLLSTVGMSTTKVYIIYYSLYGHVGLMAREVHRGAKSVEGVEATLWQVPETLPEKILEKMKAPPKEEDVAVIKPEQLLEADGFLFGFPSRFGMMAAQCKAFFDATNGIWETQALAGKPAGIFWSTGFHGGGQEMTALTSITQLAHHGMIYVPMGYAFGNEMLEMNEVKGGSSYGAGTFAGDGTRLPSDIELKQAFHQGQYLAKIAKKLKVQPP